MRHEVNNVVGLIRVFQQGDYLFLLLLRKLGNYVGGIVGVDVLDEFLCYFPAG